jgi:hypothetical protein
MANIALRNPQFKSVTLGVTENSASCRIKINGTTRYLLTKNRPNTGGFVSSQITLNFDISELARDYLEIAYQTNYVAQTIAIETDITTYTLKDAQGTIVQTLATIEDVGFEAYGTFLESVNPIVPFRSLPTYLIPEQNPSPLLTPTFEILVPENEDGRVPYINASGVSSLNYSSSATSIVSGDFVLLTIKRASCSKYGDGLKIIYINKYGAQQDLWFFLKNSKQIARTNEGYKSNIISYPSDSGATYNKKDAANKVFNTQAKQSHSLSSGYYPEASNQLFEELLLSEYVWLEVFYNGLQQIVPVKVKDSSVAFKTSLNDRLIQYTMEFEEAFDYINNIR